MCCFHFHSIQGTLWSALWFPLWLMGHLGSFPFNFEIFGGFLLLISDLIQTEWHTLLVKLHYPKNILRPLVPGLCLILGSTAGALTKNRCSAAHRGSSCPVCKMVGAPYCPLSPPLLRRSIDSQLWLCICLSVFPILSVLTSFMHVGVVLQSVCVFTDITSLNGPLYSSKCHSWSHSSPWNCSAWQQSDHPCLPMDRVCIGTFPVFVLLTHEACIMSAFPVDHVELSPAFSFSRTMSV